MRIKGLAIFAVLLAITQAPVAVAAAATGQTGANRPGANRQSPPVSTSSIAAPQSTTIPTPKTDSEDGARDYPPPRITVANPAPTPLTWTLHDKIAWAADLVLAIVGYVGIMLAVSLLKKIDRQTAYAETAAEAAAASAHAALLNAQAVIHAERPWILITVEPSRGMENSFTVMATNRGRTPARIIDSAEQIRIAVDETRLPSTPEYENEKPGATFAPVILLPGESTAIKPICRDDARGLCDSEERFKRI